MDITNFYSLADAIHYINHRAVSDKYTSDDVALKMQLVHKKTNQIINAYVLDSEYFDLECDGQIFEENDPKLEQIIDRTLRMYEESDF